MKGIDQPPGNLWNFTCYDWKGESWITIQKGRIRLGAVKGGPEYAHEMAKALGGIVKLLGEVRESPRITVKEVVSYQVTVFSGGALTEDNDWTPNPMGLLEE